MKIDTPVPFARLNRLQEKPGLGDRGQKNLLKHTDTFLKEKERFSEASLEILLSGDLKCLEKAAALKRVAVTVERNPRYPNAGLWPQPNPV